MKGKISDYLFISSKRGRLTLDIEQDFRNSYDRLKDADIDITIKKYSEPRTLKANAYLWTLLTEIGNRLRYSKEDIYFDMLRRYGQGGAASVQKRFAEKFERTNKYFDRLGESELNGAEWVHYRFWVGSHEYNREEFSILLDGVVYEAEQLGIETKPKEEIESMLKEYERKEILLAKTER